MITIVDDFTLCVVLGEEEDPVSLKVTAMKDEKVYHGIITSDMKPKKLQNYQYPSDTSAYVRGQGGLDRECDEEDCQDMV